MGEIGIDISREFPKPLTDEVVRAADQATPGSRVLVMPFAVEVDADGVLTVVDDENDFGVVDGRSLRNGRMFGQRTDRTGFSRLVSPTSSEPCAATPAPIMRVS